MLRIVFMGTGEIAIPSLQWLLRGKAPDLEVVGVFTQPDKKVGRGQVLTSPKVKVLAEERGIPVFQPTRLRGNDGALAQAESLHADINVVMAYGQMLPKKLIETPAIACVNLHASLLPRHRGASPIQAAIREGDPESGITLMHMTKALDAGDIILSRSLPIRPGETGGSLHDRLASLGPDILEEGLPLLAAGIAPRTRQDQSLITVSGKLSREDGEIRWSEPAEKIERLIRAYDPWPGTHTFIQEEDSRARQLKIFPATKVGPADGQPPGTVKVADGNLIISCGQGSTLILHGDLQLEGRKRLSTAEFLRGASFGTTRKLGKK